MTCTSAKLRNRIAFLVERDGPNCWVCEVAVVVCSPDIDDCPYHASEMRGARASLDHVLPKGQGGTLESVDGERLSNCRLAHQWCNESRGQRPPSSFNPTFTRARAKFATHVLIPMVAYGLIEAAQALEWSPRQMRRLAPHLVG